MAIRPEIALRLKKFVAENPNYTRLAPKVQTKLRDTSLQYQDDGTPFPITREDRFNPLKQAALQIPGIGGAISAPTERNLLGNVFGRPAQAFQNVQAGTLQRAAMGDTFEGFLGKDMPLGEKIMGAPAALGQDVLDTGREAVEGFTAPRGTVQSAFGLEQSQEKGPAAFISNNLKQRMSEGGKMGAGDIAATTLKATASDIVGVINDIALDPAANFAFVGAGPIAGNAGRALLSKGMPVGAELVKIERFIKAIEKTKLGKGFKARFKQNFGDFIDVAYRKGAARPIVDPLGPEAQIGAPKAAAKAPAQQGALPFGNAGAPALPAPTAGTPPGVASALTPAAGQVPSAVVSFNGQQILADVNGKVLSYGKGKAPNISDALKPELGQLVKNKLQVDNTLQPPIFEGIGGVPSKTEGARTGGFDLTQPTVEAKAPAPEPLAPTIQDLFAGEQKPVVPKPEPKAPVTTPKGEIKKFMKQVAKEPKLLSPAKKAAQPDIIKAALRDLEAAIKKNPTIKENMSPEELKAYNDGLQRFGIKGKPPVAKPKPVVEKKPPVIEKKNIIEKASEKPATKETSAFIEGLTGDQGTHQAATGPYAKPEQYGLFRKGGDGRPIRTFATRAAAEAELAKPNNPLKAEKFLVERIRKQKFIKLSPEKKAELMAKQAAKAKAQVPAVRSAQGLIGTEVLKGKKITKAVANAADDYIKALEHTKKVVVIKKGKTQPSAAYDDARFKERVALDDLSNVVAEELKIDPDSPLVLKAVNKLLSKLRDKGGFVRIGKGKPKIKKLLKKAKKKRAITFGKMFKKNAQEILKLAREAKMSVVDYIRANPKQFPNSPKTVRGLNQALAEHLQDIPVKVKNLTKNAVVGFKKSGELGIVEGVGDEIAVRFKEGLSKFTPEEAAKVLRESGQVLNLSKLPKKELPQTIAKILSKNPKHQTLAEVANASIDAALKNPDDPLVQAKATQVTKRLMAALTDKTIDINDIPSVARAHGLTSDQLIADLVTELGTKSREAGQTLNILSQTQKKLKRLLSKEQMEDLFPEGEAGIHPVQYGITKAFRVLNRGANLAKGFLTSQFKTAARNAEVQGAVAITEIAEQAVVGLYQKLSGTGIKGKEFAGVKAYQQAVKGGIQDMVSFAKNLRKLKLGRTKERALFKLLEEFPIDKANLFKAPIHDVVVNEGFIRAINAANILQENFYRTVFVEAELAKIAAKHGTTIRDIKFFKNRGDEVAAGVEKGLLNTFASNLRHVPFFKTVIEGFKKFPIAGFAAGNPFVRFYFNALNFILRRNPAQFLNLTSPKFRKALGGPSNEAQAKVLTEALTGTLFFAAAMALRTDKFAGPKFYQIDITPWDKTDDKFFDTRAFAPMPQYMFMVEWAKNLMGNKEQTTLTSTDFFQGLLSVSRIAGTGLMFADLMRSEPFKEKVSAAQSAKARGRLIKSYFGQILSAPSVPLGQFQDIVGAFDPEENRYKFIQGDPLLGPTINNIPFLKRILPDLEQIGRPKARQPGRVAGLIEFGTGLRIQKINRFEQELARHGLSGLHPRMGDPENNQTVINEVNEGLFLAGMDLIRKKAYVNANNKKQSEMLRGLVSDVFEVGREWASIFDKKVQKDMAQKQVDRIRSEVNKGIAKDLLEVYTTRIGVDKDTLFSESLRKAISGKK